MLPINKWFLAHFQQYPHIFYQITDNNNIDGGFNLSKIFTAGKDVS